MGIFKKIYAKLEQAQVNAVEDIGGQEAAILTEASIKAENVGGKVAVAETVEKHFEGVASRTMNDRVAESVRQLMDEKRRHGTPITGGQEVKEHGGVPVTPAGHAGKNPALKR